ncbi:MAG: long-chain fatty acid--CoA ligase [Deltaproteobacteria bacterium]|nr:long-chain fatty acid--CoA ligase [Deltaproteobacteria bacterium]
MAENSFKNMHEQIVATVTKRSDNTAFKWFLENGDLAGVTWTEFYKQLQQTAKSLMSLGVAKGDKVNVLSNTCYRWVLSDFAVVSIGGATVGIYQSNLAKDCQYIIDHSDAVVIFAEDDEQLQKLQEIRKEIPNIRKVVMFNGSHKGDDWVIDFDDFILLGKDISDDEFQKRAGSVESIDTAGIIYTSGTTGVPKGAVISNGNFLFTTNSVKKAAKFEDDDQTFLFLPLAHVFARILVNSVIAVGNTMTFFRGMETLVDDFQIVRPHFFSSVPRIFEKVYSKVISGAEAKGGAALKIFNWAKGVGSEVSELIIAKKNIPFMLGLKYKVATKLVFSKVQGALGGRVRFCISGAAPLNPEIAKFFHGAGVLVLEGLGMSENTSVTNVNRPDNYKFGYVGQPVEGVEQKIAEDGEICFRGGNIMQEYYKMPEKTAETFRDGWLLTGDLGEIDKDNFLKVTGRKKDLIITAGGKNIAPSRIEGIIATSKYINQICIIGDQRKFLSALVTLDEENVKAYADESGISYTSFDDLIRNAQIQTLLEAEVAQKNKELASFEQIKKINLVPEFTVENEMITPTFKIKKNIVSDAHKATIDGMYPD